MKRGIRMSFEIDLCEIKSAELYLAPGKAVPSAHMHCLYVYVCVNAYVMTVCVIYALSRRKI